MLMCPIKKASLLKPLKIISLALVQNTYYKMLHYLIQYFKHFMSN